MRKVAVKVAVAVVLIVLFLAANRGAYEGFFSGDDLDNIAWTPSTSWQIFVQAFLSPLHYAHNFRPAGHLVFHTLGAAPFPVYVALLQTLHWLVAGLV